jgi:hypothetical protein
VGVSTGTQLNLSEWVGGCVEGVFRDTFTVVEVAYIGKFLDLSRYVTFNGHSTQTSFHCDLTFRYRHILIHPSIDVPFNSHSTQFN